MLIMVNISSRDFVTGGGIQKNLNLNSNVYEGPPSPHETKSAKRKMWNEKCETKSVKQKVWNKKLETKSVKQKVWNESEKQKVWSKKYETKSVKQKMCYQKI